MNTDPATEIANAWAQAGGNDPSLHTAYNALRRAIRQLVPGEVTASGAAVIDTAPTALVLAGSGLFVVKATTSEDGRSATVTVKRLPVIADGVVVEVVDGLSGTWDGSSALLRHWSFRLG